VNGADVDWSAVQYVRDKLGLAVVNIASLADLMAFLDHSADPALAQFKAPVAAYRERYGV
jgi:orotate phosphoribosyltransferase